MITLAGVCKRFGPRQILDGLTLGFAEGESFGLVGRSGAGKSTTLRLLATLVRPDEGKMIVCGFDLDRGPASVRRLMGYLPQHSGVYRRQTAREYLEFYAGVHGVSRARRRPLAGQLLEALDLAGHVDDEVANMTRGEQRRLAIGRTLVHDPAVLLLDEPMSGLDPESQEQLRELFRELKAMGKTMLISSPTLADVDGLCTSLGVLDHGRMTVSGPVAEVRAQVTAALLNDKVTLGQKSGADHSECAAVDAFPRPVVQQVPL